MTILLIPVAPLSKSKSRLENCFSRDQLEEFTIAMFRDLGNTLLKVNCYEEKIVYCESSEILEQVDDYGLIGIKEEVKEPRKSLDEIFKNLNNIVIKKFNAEATVMTFLDLVLISAKNFYEINSLIEKNQLVICPAIQSAGISILGRNPPDILDR